MHAVVTRDIIIIGNSSTFKSKQNASVCLVHHADYKLKNTHNFTIICTYTRVVVVSQDASLPEAAMWSSKLLSHVSTAKVAVNSIRRIISKCFSLKSLLSFVSHSWHQYLIKKLRAFKGNVQLKLCDVYLKLWVNSFAISNVISCSFSLMQDVNSTSCQFLIKNKALTPQ